MVAGINPAITDDVRAKAATLHLTENAFVNRCLDECVSLMNSPGVWRTPDVVRHYRNIKGESSELSPTVEKLLELLLGDFADDPQRHGLCVLLAETIIESGFEVTSETARELAAFCKKAKPNRDLRRVEVVGGFEIVTDEKKKFYRIRNSEGMVAGAFTDLRAARNFLHPIPSKK